jgi:uncharacterized protein (TIGR00251 family)
MKNEAGRDSRTQPADLPPWCRPVAGGVELALHVQPGARREACVGEHGGRLKIAVAAPALEGRANDALLALLAACLALPRSALSVVAGDSSRHKRVQISSGECTAEDVAALLLAATRAGGGRK